MNGYYTNRNEYMVKERYAQRAISRLDRVLDVIYALLAFVAGALRDRTVRRVIRYSVVAVCFFAFVGLIGGIEQGLISIGSAIFAGLGLIFVEILCLK